MVDSLNLICYNNTVDHKDYINTHREAHDMSNLTKKFSVAGVTTNPQGKTKIRFANDSMRVKILAKNGHEGINLVNLPNEMYKHEIAAFLLETDFAKGNQATLDAIAYIAKKNPAPEQDSTSVEVEATAILTEDGVTA